MTLVPPTPKDSMETETISKKISSNTTNSTIAKKQNAISDPSRTVRTSSRDQKLDKHRYHNSSISIPKNSYGKLSFNHVPQYPFQENGGLEVHIQG